MNCPPREPGPCPVGVCQIDGKGGVMSDVDERQVRASRPEGYLRLLGRFELRTRARVAHLSPPQQHLVALTALRRGTRERTARLLWPDVDGVRAQARLRTAMWRLRKTCP